MREGGTFMTEVNIFLAFGAGFLSFISPCVLPFFPAFLSYITGMSVSEINQDKQDVNTKKLCYIQSYFYLVFLVSLL